MVDSKIIEKMVGFLQTAEKRNVNIVRCRSQKILKLVSKVKKKTLLFCLATNELKLDFIAPLRKWKHRQLQLSAVIVK